MVVGIKGLAINSGFGEVIAVVFVSWSFFTDFKP
jgi:hypothetical protein